MTPSLDPAAIERLRSRSGRPATEPPSPAVDGAGSDAEVGPDAPGWFEGGDWATKARSFKRRLLAPVEERMRVEVARAVEQQDQDLKREVDELRAELIRTRTAHDAELAALNEQLRNHR